MEMRILCAGIAIGGMSLIAWGCDKTPLPKKTARAVPSTASATTSAAAPPTTKGLPRYEAAGLRFQAAEALPRKENIGSKAMPATEFGLDDSNGQEFRVIVSEFPAGAGGPAESGDVEGMMGIGRTTYLADSKPAESKVERVILGKKTSGAKSSGSIPRPLRLGGLCRRTCAETLRLLGLQVR